MQPRLFVSAVFLSVLCGRGCDLQAGNPTLLSSPCHQLPGYVPKDRAEPVLVSACLSGIRLGRGSPSAPINFFTIYLYDLIAVVSQPVTVFMV